jgi:hypothetical protein
MQKLIQPPACLDHGLQTCVQTEMFSAKPFSKNAGETSIVLLITAREQRVPTSCDPNQNRAALLADFFIFSK